MPQIQNPKSKIENRSGHPVFFRPDAVRRWMRVQALLIAASGLMLAAGAVWWALGGPGWALAAFGLCLLPATFVLAVAWRRRREKAWWGGRRGDPPYLKPPDGKKGY